MPSHAPQEAMSVIDLNLLDQHGLKPDVYYEAVIMIIALILTGHALESRAKRQTSAALRRLAALQPPTARVVRAVR